MISGERALLVRRATDPARGEWSIPGGLVETGETLAAAVARELFEETGVRVRVHGLIEATERIFFDPAPPSHLPRSDGAKPPSLAKPRYHFVILDYLCELLEGEPRTSDEISDFAFVPENELERYSLTPAVSRILGKAFAMARARATA